MTQAAPSITEVEMQTPATDEPLASANAQMSISRFYRPELDVVRFIAFQLVFFAHLLPLRPRQGLPVPSQLMIQSLYIVQETSVFGLSLFFALSAFLICELLLRERAATGTVQVRQFYIRLLL